MVVASRSGPKISSVPRRVAAVAASRKIFGSGDVGADVEDQQSRQQADEEQRAPGDFLRKYLEHDGGEDRRRAPTPGPGALHRADSPAAIFGADHFADQH
jgi:hypothetical protein